jgi:transcription elongation factor
VINGDLTGLLGTVKSKNKDLLTFIPDLKDLDDPFEVEASFCVKNFKPGENVRVVQGNHQGETGTVLNHQGQFVSVSIDGSFREIKVKSIDIRLKTDLSMGNNY